jgi:biotin-(acetyl-CoA carboxylase) ligase
MAVAGRAAGRGHHRAAAEREITGTFRDVDGAGNLVLETPGGTRRIAAAEIFF